jgi:hypothetical protein
MVVTVPFKSYSRLLEDVLKVVSRIFITFLPPFPLMKQGIFILGGKKEKKSDLLLIKLQKDHYFLSFKIC